MSNLSPIHGKDLVKILSNQFNFQPIRQKGSHVTLTNGTIYVTVPLKEIRIGLPGTILHDCGITREEFLKQT